jgi:hypothetical protein
MAGIRPGSSEIRTDPGQASHSATDRSCRGEPRRAILAEPEEEDACEIHSIVNTETAAS